MPRIGREGRNIPFNGSGVYSAPSNSWSPAVAATTISSTDWNSLRTDLQTALSTAICKDGQTTVTANLPMATYRHTGVGNAQALTDYATADQVVDNALCYGGASAAGSDTYAVNLAVSPGAYAAGQRYSFIADVANTGACTINFNTIGAADIKMMDGTDPVNNMIIANQPVELIYDGTNMVLLNPHIGYTTGSFTPALSGTGTAGSPTYTSRTGTYARLGNYVFVSFSMILSSKGGLTGNVNFTGWPVAAGSPSQFFLDSVGSFLSVPAHPPFVYLSGSTATFKYYSAGAMNSLVDTDINDTFSFSGSGFYLV